MKFNSFIISVLLLVIVGCTNEETLFNKISPQRSGVDFNNRLDLNDSLTVLEFEYMYNGAGVGVGDFDQDGLQDIFFTGNMVSNRLYRNLGDFKFEDITQSAHVTSKNWSNGVAVVDIDQNGLPDIYVSRGGPRGSTSKERANLLYINQGVKNGELSFTEEAEKWGIADSGYSVQAAFFDYDRDGDLDLYLLSNALVDFNRNTSRPKDRSGKAPSADKLYRNNGDHTFTDVSNSCGILIEGFGLGVEICDMNTDGWPDVYVSNDFLTDDLLYINQQDGTFKNEIADYFRHLTFNGMGNDIADINNDGLMDVVVLDMLPEENKRWKLTMMGNNYDEHQTGLSYGYQPQYIRNTLQMNNGNGSFSEIGQLAGISATEWSWSALFADFDHDGLKDLCITNGYRQDITNLDFMVYGNRVLTMGTEEANRKKRLEELNRLPGIKLHNYYYKNADNLTFSDHSKAVGFDEPSYSNGMAYADFDNDGDLDLIMSNIDDPAFLYENTMEKYVNDHRYLKFRFQGKAPNRSALGSTVRIFYDGKSQKQYFTPYRGYLSTVESSLHFGLAHHQKVDSVEVIWPDGKRQLLSQVETNQEILLKYSDANTFHKSDPPNRSPLIQSMDSSSIQFSHTENDFVDFKIQPLLPHMHSKNGPGIAIGDINGDAWEDIFIGGAAGQKGQLFVHTQADGFDTIPINTNMASEDMGVLLFDADNDRDLDLYVTSGGSSFVSGSEKYRDRMYKNDDHGNFTMIEDLALPFESASVVTAADYNKDGLLDLFVGGRVRPGEYPTTPQSMILTNTSAGADISFQRETLENADINSLGMVTAALWTDFNNDTWTDLIVIGEFMPIRFFKNNKGTLAEVTQSTGLKETKGWWNSISSGDFDKDGDIDYMLGNLGLNSRFKASGEEPLAIHAKDFDQDGRLDPIMSHYVQGVHHIAHSRNDLIEQINAMRARFKSYSEYAEATFEESFLEEELADAFVVKSETFANSYLENLGEGSFRLSALPKKSQTAPIYGWIVGDYNLDGNLDALAVGNFYSGEVFGGRYDASIGWFLAGDGKGSFESIPARESGFFVKGDAKGMASLKQNDKERIFTTLNNGPLKEHIIDRSSQRLYKANPKDMSIRILFKDGSMQKHEFYWGSGYLSQSSRAIYFPKDVVSATVMDSHGNETQIQLVP